MSKKSSYIYSATPTVRAPRNPFDLSHRNITTMNVGTLYPIYCEEILPGDDFKVKTNFVSRVTSAFLKPVMDNVIMDIHYFFVPCRLCFDKWEQIFGQNDNGYWAATGDVEVPMIGVSDPNSTSAIGTDTIMNRLYGIPPTDNKVNNKSLSYLRHPVSVIPARAFALIYNEWYRDENFIPPVNVKKGGLSEFEKFEGSSVEWSVNVYTGGLPKVSKRPDYFTSALPAPQKGAAPLLNLGGYAPVGTRHKRVNDTGYLEGTSDIEFQSISPVGERRPVVYINAGDDHGGIYTVDGKDIRPSLTVIPEPYAETALNPVNLWADLSAATGVDASQFRNFMQVQKMLERDARGGTRYVEYLRSAFGVSSPDSRLQRPEYLFGFSQPLNIQQVAQTSEPTTASPLGSLGAYSWTASSSRQWRKGFPEHGYVIGCASLRYKHSYQQGIARKFTRKTRYDFYDPIFRSASEQPIYTYELFGLTASSDGDDTIFGYKPPWNEYRDSPDIITGQANSYAKLKGGANSNMDIWHFGDTYASAPTLTKSFIQETPAPVDRTLAVPSTTEDQFLIDFFFDVLATRPLPSHGVPGYVDHF